MSPWRLSSLTTAEAGNAGSRKSVAILPTGATEQHGPHLPLGTDAMIAKAVAEKVATSMERVVVTDPISYGCSWHHTRFPGTITLRTKTFIALVVDVGQSLSSAGFVPVILNGHGGNRAPLQVALTELAEAGVRAYAFTYFDLLAGRLGDIIPDSDTSTGHAGALETSLIMYLWPQAVKEAMIPSGGTPSTWPDPHMFAQEPVSVARPFDEINPAGVIGSPSTASVEKGERIFALASSRCQEVVARILEETT